MIRRAKQSRGAKPVRLCPSSSDVNLFRYGKGIIDFKCLVVCPPGEKHWHGATAMSHIAIQEALNGKVVDWLEK